MPIINSIKMINYQFIISRAGNLQMPLIFLPILFRPIYFTGAGSRRVLQIKEHLALSSLQTLVCMMTFWISTAHLLTSNSAFLNWIRSLDNFNVGVTSLQSLWKGAIDLWREQIGKGVSESTANYVDWTQSLIESTRWDGNCVWWALHIA